MLNVAGTVELLLSPGLLQTVAVVLPVVAALCVDHFQPFAIPSTSADLSQAGAPRFRRASRLISRPTVCPNRVEGVCLPLPLPNPAQSRLGVEQGDYDARYPAGGITAAVAPPLPHGGPARFYF